MSLLRSLRLSQLLLHTPQVSRYRHLMWATTLMMTAKKIVQTRTFLIMWTKKPGYYIFSTEFWRYCPSLDYQNARCQPPCEWQHFFSRNAICFDNITMLLLHSCTHYDLDHSCSILHKWRGTVTWFSFSVGKAIQVSIPNRTGHTTRLHGVY